MVLIVQSMDKTPKRLSIVLVRYFSFNVSFSVRLKSYCVAIEMKMFEQLSIWSYLLFLHNNVVLNSKSVDEGKIAVRRTFSTTVVNFLTYVRKCAPF